LLNKSVNLSVKIANKIVTDTSLIRTMRDTAAVLDKKVIEYKEAFVRSSPQLASAVLAIIRHDDPLSGVKY